MFSIFARGHCALRALRAERQRESHALRPLRRCYMVVQGWRALRACGRLSAHEHAGLAVSAVRVEEGRDRHRHRSRGENAAVRGWS